MSAFQIPTTAGSIITFEDWEDTKKTTKCRYVITLVPSAINANGELINLFWMDAYAEEGGIFGVTEEGILAGNPEILFEAPEQTLDITFDPEEARKYGAVVRLNNHFNGDHIPVTFTPGALNLTDGSVLEAFWIDGYGTCYKQEEINEYATALLVEGTDTLD